MTSHSPRVLIGCVFLIGAQLEIIHNQNSGFYIDESAHRQTVLVANLHSQHKKAIKQQILDLLGLQKRPRPLRSGNSNSAPHHMLDVYRALEDAEDSDEDGVARRIRKLARRRSLTLPGMERELGQADMITSFLNRAPRGKDHPRHSGHRRYYFDMSAVPPDQRLSGAELRLYRRGGHGDVITLDIYMLLNEDGREFALESSVRAAAATRAGAWHAINVTRAARVWLRDDARNLGLYLVVTDENGADVEPRRAGVVTGRSHADQRAFMVAFFTTAADARLHAGRARRLRRGAQNDVSYREDSPYGDAYGAPYTPPHYSSGRSCQKRTLYVDFKDLKWEEWIIAPEGYSAYSCQGECSFPLNVHMNATNHAIVQTLVHLMAPQAVPQPSCAPTKLSAISVLYFDDNSNVILKKYRNMVARSCGCH